MSELQDVVSEYKEMQEGVRKDQDEEAREQLVAQINPIAEKLDSLLNDKFELEMALKEKNKEILEKEQEIRVIWGPFIVGMSKADLKILGDRKIVAEAVINIKRVDEDACTKWLLANGYENAMKYQIHIQTFKKIAREKMNEGVFIDGAQYDKFTKIKLK